MPHWALKKRARDLGLARTKEQPWSERELEILARYAWMSDERIPLKLKAAGYARTVTEIHLKLKRMGFEHDGSSFASTVKRNLTIHHNRHEPVIFYILELHDLMATPRQMPPSARLLRVLFDRLIFVPSDCERCSSQVLPTRRADRYRLTIHAHRRTRHQLRGNRF
jgi:hypothetical protein